MPTTPLDPLDFHKTLEAGDQPVIVAFIKPGCGACRAMVGALEQIAIPSYLVDGEDGPGLVVEYEIFDFPGLFLWLEGEYHARLHCAPTPVKIVEAVAAALLAPPEQEP
jgi:thiol-disulfide isomerase/thioredoxin